MDNLLFALTYKVCSRCKTEKLISEFSKSKFTKDGYSHTCKQCDSDKYKQTKRYQKVLERKKRIRTRTRKTCSKCKTEKPLEEFIRDSSSVDGYATICKECKNKEGKEIREKSPARQRRLQKERDALTRTKKVCTKCGVEKDLSEFYEDKKARDGHVAQCKECSRKYHKKYNQDHKEEISSRRRARHIANLELDTQKRRAYNQKNREKRREQKRKDYQKHKEERNKRQREKYAENPEPFKKASKEYIQKNPKKVSERVSKWAKKNPDKVRGYKRKWNQNNKELKNSYTIARRSKAKNVLCTLDDAQWLWLLEQTNFGCMQCGEPDKRMHRDHIIPLDPGTTTLDNTQPLCRKHSPEKGRKCTDYRPEWLKELVKQKMIELGLTPLTEEELTLMRCQVAMEEKRGRGYAK